MGRRLGICCPRPGLSIFADTKKPQGGNTPGALLMFETPGSEVAFLNVADGTEGLDVIAANAGALAEHGVLGEAWILPPPYSLDRMPLAELY